MLAQTLLARLWRDDAGSVIATEYMILGSVVALGSVAGLDAMREATVSEMKEYGNSVRSIRQSYNVSGMSTGIASKAGSGAQDSCNAAGCP